MSDKKSDQWDEKIDRFGEKYKLWLVIPLVISGLIALKNPYAGFGFLLFLVSVWLFVWSIGKILNAFGRLLPKSLGPVDVQDSHLMLSLIQGCKQEESSLDPFRSNRCPVGAD